jgi:hypothetical protein
MANSQQCAHPGCTCVVPANGPYGKYCSEHCKKAKDIVELKCECLHADCR